LALPTTRLREIRFGNNWPIDHKFFFFQWGGGEKTGAEKESDRLALLLKRKIPNTYKIVDGQYF